MAQPQDPSQGWARWLPQHPNSDYQMVDTSLMQYTSTPTTTTAVHRNTMPTQFMASHAYANIAPMPSPQAPQYSSGNTFMFGQYTPPSPPPITPSFKQYQEECPPSRTITTDTNIGYQRDPYQTHSLEQDARPTIKYEPEVAILRSPVPTPITVKTITRNVAENEDNEIVFNTEVDDMMKAIQAKAEPDDSDFAAAAYPSPPHLDEEKFNLRRKSCTPDQKSPTSSQSGKERQKKYVCDIKGCGKRCSQKTQLETHKRAHTGEKPFECEVCGERFTQRGNLKTHSRRHTGEKPYHCDICGQPFAQLGNVKPHRLTHYQTKPFRCIFSTCQKTFGQRGNLKTHHNRFHKDDIKELTMKFKNLAPGDELPEEDKKLFKHFAELYKNSNKGIKGRGSNRTKRSKHSTSEHHSPSTPGGPHQNPVYSLLSYQMYRLPPQHGLPCPDTHGNISLPRHGSQGSIVVPRDHHAPYGSYEMDQASIASSGTLTTSTNSPSTVYEDDYGRSFAAPHRMY
ncbi:uncharacterized protein F4807DRAFT_10568 [Annulohypoxylon truncatum]|uniref:uncharacterized protein n=1 Tax=Annulohypoxylon truncatum TaxID=327061 RepID=UPI0020081241|nr:uncharacterized protein F4807DRAFT_10568 [Annulohypoxylon truncatum]KAI1214858.1 hypothetical protein F4807DRAFT_10568 [Annulohypoxylon truncatum]